MKNGTYRLHSRFERVLNYAAESGAMVSLVRREIGAGPGHVILEPLPDPAPAQIEVMDEAIRIGATTVSRADDPYAPSLIVEHIPHAKQIDAMLHALLPLMPKQSLAFLLAETREEDFQTDTQRHLCARIKEGVALLERGQFADGAQIMRGLGFGLTPSGDDFLCGYLYALALDDTRHATRDTLFQTALGDNWLVNHFLRAAHDGFYFEHFKAFTFAVCSNNVEDARSALASLLTVGATSGADTAAGFITGLKHIVAERQGTRIGSG